MSFTPALVNPMTSPLWNNEPSEWTPATITDFTGGLCTAFSETNIRDNQFVTLNNWYFRQDNSIIVRGPFRPYLVTSKETIIPDSAAPLSFTWMELGGTDFLVSCWDAGASYEVSVLDASNNRWAGDGGGTSIKTDLTDGYKAQYVKFSVNDAEDMIFCNGKDTPQRWIGTIDTASSNLGLTAPTLGTPTLQGESKVASGPGISVTANFYYKFTAFYDSSGTNTKYGESGGTTAATIAIAGVDGTPSAPTIEDCPDIPTGATRNYVYRSPAGETNGPYRRVGYYTDATEAEFVDNLDVGNEGIDIPADAGTPPKIKNILSFKGRIWGVGLNASGQLTNKGVWSSSGQPDMFPALNYTYFPDALIGPVAFGENVYWITEKQIYVTPNGDIDTYPDPLKICDRGCTSFDSIVDVGNGLVFQSDDNIYWVDFNSFNEKDGDFPFPIGESIRDKIKNIPVAYKINSTSCLHKDRYYLSYTGINQTVNTATLVWDVTAGIKLLKQGLYGGWSSLDWAANDLQSFKGILYSADNTNKYIMEHDFAGADDYYSKTEYDASTNYSIITELKTKKFLFVQNPILARSVLLQAVTSGASYRATLSFDAGTFERIATFTLGSDSLAVDNNWLIWGQGTWGNFNWGASTRAAQYSHKKIPSGGKGRDLQINLSCSDNQDSNITELTFYYKLLPRRLGS